MNYSATATLDYADAMGPEQSTVTTQTYVVPSLTENRNITFQNNCPFKVWFSLNGSALNNSPSCTKDTDCPSGTRCNTSTSSCYWKNYASPNDTYLLSANGGSNSVTIPLHPNTDPNIQWSGNFSASTLCISGQNCGQAECGNQGGDAPCAPGVGFKQPATQAEITMNRNTGDSYDLEVINGFHIPIAMKPIYYPSIDAIPDNYNCGTPGEFKEVNGFGGCDWRSASPNGNGYYWVTNSGNTCNITAPSCAGGTVCGLNESFQQVCGNFLGYWTANEVCGKSNVPASVRAFFHCDIALPAGYPQNSTIYDLMACAVPTGDTNPTFNSCYLNYSGFSRSKISQCCGCSDWWTEGVAANPHTQSCTPAGQTSAQSSPEWKQYVFPGLVWIKKACPSSYTYPFDDKTSGFGCTNNAQNAPNSTGYTLTFCPGNSGLPHGINEGRQ